MALLLAMSLGALASVLTPTADAAITTNETPPTFVRNIGTRGGVPPSGGDMVEPSDLAVAPNGDVYVTDRATNRVVRFSATGTHLGSWGGTPAGSGPGELDKPRGLAVGPDGSVYVADTGNHRVQRFTATGQFVSTWGTEGVGDGRFIEPRAIAVGPDGDVWVGDVACRIQRFSPTGEFVSGWGSCGSGAAQISLPEGIAIAGDGTLFVASLGHSRVFHVTADGSTLLGFLGPVGTGDGETRDPLDVDRGPDGRLYVADRGNRRVQRFTADGQFEDAWGTAGLGDGQFQDLAGLGVSASGDVYTAEWGPPPRAPDPDPLHLVQRFTAEGDFVARWGAYGDGMARFWTPKDVAAAPDGGLVVVDIGNQAVTRSGPDLVFDTTWGHYGSGPGEFIDPEAVAVAGTGDIYVADTGNHRVQHFTATGSFLGEWGSAGPGPGEFDQPAGIDVDASGDVWVGDRGNDRVQRFSSSGVFEASIGTGGTGVDQFQAPSAVAVSEDGVFVADTGNHRIQHLEADGTFADGWAIDPSFPPVGVSAAPHGGVWVEGQSSGGGSRTWRYTPDGTRLTTFAGDVVRGRGLAVGADGHLFIADEYHFSDRLVEVAPDPGPLVAVALSAATPTAEVGRRIDFPLVVRNTGDQTMTGLAATYSATPGCDGPLADVAPGATLRTTCHHLATGSDVGLLSNRVSVTSEQISEPVQSVAGAADVSVTYPSPVELAVIGGAGAGPGELDGAADLAAGAPGELFVLNRAQSQSEIDVYDAGASLGAFPVASGVAIAGGAGDDLFILRSRNSRDVRRYTSSGVSVGPVPLTVSGDVGSVNGIDTTPTDGHLLMTELHATYLWCDAFHCEYRTAGTSALRDIDPATGIAQTVTGGGGLAVAGAGNRSYTLSTDASIVVREGSTQVRAFSVGAGATDLDVDPSGIAFVAYGDTDLVKVFSPEGLLVARWATPADRVTVGPDGLVYVLDAAAGVVRVFGFGVSGVVADEMTDAPLPGVVAIAVDSVGHVAAAAVSGSDGRYRLRVGPGQYRVAFMDPSGAHLGEWAWGQPLSAPTSGAAVSVGATGARVDIGLLPARGAVTGTVTADGGGSVAGAWAAAVDLASGVLRGAVGGGDGTYDLESVPTGEQVMVFVDPSGQRRFEFFDDGLFLQNADPVTVIAGAASAASAGLAAQGPLSGGSTISGTVTGASGGPVAGAWVLAVRSDGVMRAGAVTDASGAYSLVVGRGSYRVEVLDPAGAHTGQWVPDRALDDYDGAQVVTVDSGETATVDAGLASNRGSMAGVVSGPSGAAAGAVVLAISTVSGQVSGAATAAGDGSYVVGGLVPGEYLVAFVDPWGELGSGFEYHSDTTNPGAATSVSVTAAHTTTVDAALG